MLCLVVLLLVAPLLCSAVTNCPAGCSCGHSRSRSSVDCSGGSLASVPASLDPGTNILDLSDNSIDTLPDFAFSRYAGGLQKLVIARNNMTSVRPLAFSRLQHLWWLSLEDNRLRSLHPNTFQQAPKLWKLILNGNPLELQDAPLFNSSSLRILELSRCGLERLPSRTFSSLTGLWTLRLQSNRLTSVGALSSGDLAELEILDLHDNRLAALDAGALSGLARLKQLNVSGNPLAVPSAGPLLRAPLLSFIDLSGSRATRLAADAFAHLPSLRILRMSGCGLRSVDPLAFANLTELERVSLDGNLLRSVPAEAFATCGQLLELDLSANEGLLVRADQPLIRSASLTLLSLAGCSMQRIGDHTFRELPALSVLDTSRCGVSSVSGAALRPLPDLYELRLAGNNLTSLPAHLFNDSHRLAEVDLRGNPLSQLSRFPAAPALERLDVGRCGLEGRLAAAALADCPQLRLLRLDGNQLRGLDALERLPPLLRSISLQGNPWTCDCSLRPLWRWCHQPGSRVAAKTFVTQQEESRCPEDVTCGTPDGAHWDLLDSMRCEGDPASAEELEGDHDPNLDVEVISVAGRISAANQ